MDAFESTLPEAIDNDEDLARFLTQSSHFTTVMVKPSAFLPSQTGETSVSRHGRNPSENLWSIGLVAAGDRNLHGAAILKARDVRAISLEVYPDEPPPLHAAIRKWPILTDPALQKAKRKDFALLLAKAAGQPLLRN